MFNQSNDNNFDHFTDNSHSFQQPLINDDKGSNNQGSFWDKILRIKPIDEVQGRQITANKTGGKVQYKRMLQRHHLTMFGIGNTIGAGIFALTGLGAQYAGPSLCLSFLLSGMISMATAMVYSELSSRMPSSGSSYHYIYCTFGELPAWVIGWNMNLRYGICAAALARAWTSYFVGLMRIIGLPLPTWMYSINILGYDGSLLTVLFVIFCTYIMNLGSKESNMFNYSLTIAKLISLLVIVIAALSYFDAQNLTPFVLEEKGGFMGTVQGAALIYMAFLGFDFITTLAEEAKSPQRDMPISIFSCIIICTVIYCTLSLSLSGVAKLYQLPPDTAMAVAFEVVGNKWMSLIIYLSGFFGISACAYTTLMSQPRILKSYADDGLFFKLFSEMDPFTQVRKKGTIYICIFVSLICFFLNLEEISKVISLGNLLSYSIVNISAIVLRQRDPNNTQSRKENEVFSWAYLISTFMLSLSLTNGWSKYQTYTYLVMTLIFLMCLLRQMQFNEPVDTYRCPLVPLIPCIGILGNFMLSAQMDATTWLYLGIFNLLGLSFYIGYGFRNSYLNNQQTS
eukprot:403370887